MLIIAINCWNQSTSRRSCTESEIEIEREAHCKKSIIHHQHYKTKMQTVLHKTAILLAMFFLTTEAFSVLSLSRSSPQSLPFPHKYKRDNFHLPRVAPMPPPLRSNQRSNTPTAATTTTALQESPSPSDDPEYRKSVYGESEERGKILLAVVVLLNVWIFSVPVELRRGHLCFTESCAQNRSRCYDCVTIPEWFGDIRAYYANGGGVNFDFSIEDKY